MDVEYYKVDAVKAEKNCLHRSLNVSVVFFSIRDLRELFSTTPLRELDP